jgi:hypothetical protein
MLTAFKCALRFSRCLLCALAFLVLLSPSSNPLPPPPLIPCPNDGLVLFIPFDDSPFATFPPALTEAVEEVEDPAAILSLTAEWALYIYRQQDFVICLRRQCRGVMGAIMDYGVSRRLKLVRLIFSKVLW